MNTRKSDRFILSDALSLIGANKLHLKVEDVQSVRKGLHGVLDIIHACAMTHGSIDAHHVIIEKEKVSDSFSSNKKHTLFFLGGGCYGFKKMM